MLVAQQNVLLIYYLEISLFYLSLYIQMPDQAKGSSDKNAVPTVSTIYIYLGSLEEKAPRGFWDA